MQFYKFKSLLLLAGLLSCLPAFANFTLKECLEANNELAISHKTRPFGLLERSLSFKKERCIIDVTSTSYKFWKSSWRIDVCRSPIHIKKTDGGVEVVKKETPCEANSQNEFCVESTKLMKVLQDDGLIFAEGEKANLADDHGKVNCAYLLLDQYLTRNKVFGEMTGFGGEDEAASSVIHPEPTQAAPVPIYKDPSNPELGTTPEMAPAMGTPVLEESKDSSNVSW